MIKFTQGRKREVFFLMDSPCIVFGAGIQSAQLFKEEQSRQGKGQKTQPGSWDKSLGVWQEAALPIPGLYFSFLCFNSCHTPGAAKAEHDFNPDKIKFPNPETIYRDLQANF